MFATGDARRLRPDSAFLLVNVLKLALEPPQILLEVNYLYVFDVNGAPSLVQLLLKLLVFVFEVFYLFDIRTCLGVLFGSFSVQLSPEQFQVIFCLANWFLKFLYFLVFLCNQFLQLWNFLLTEFLTWSLNKNLVIGSWHNRFIIELGLVLLFVLFVNNWYQFLVLQP